MKKLVLLIVLVSVASARDRSPKPEAAQLNIKAAPATIRTLLLADFVAQGFIIDSEVPGTQLQLSKPVRETDVVSPGRFMRDSLIGQGVGGHNRNCRRTHRAIFLPEGETTAVSLQWESSCEVQAGFGRSTDRHWPETDKKKIKWMQDELESVKERAEKPNTRAMQQAATPMAPSPPNATVSEEVQPATPAASKTTTKGQAPTPSVTKPNDCAGYERPYSSLDCHGNPK